MLDQIEEIHPSQVFSEVFLDAHTKIDREIHKLQDENEAFDTRIQLQKEKTQANARYQEHMQSVITIIEQTINKKMELHSDIVTGGEYNAPKLTLKKYDSYEFETPKDDGIGTNNRGMMLYDLAVLRKTVLHAIAHDSVLFDPMARPDMSRLLRIYEAEGEKQIFISLDKTSTCTQEAQDIIAKETVIKLENNERALFGEKWSRKAEI